MKKILYLTIIFVAILTGCKEPAPLPGGIKGIITDKATGEPIRSAGVLLSTGAKTITGDDGQYEFVELEPKEYIINVTKTGYKDVTNHKITVKANLKEPGDIQMIKLPPSLRVINDNNEDINSLDFGSSPDDVARSFNIFNDGPETLNWDITNTCEWINKINKIEGSLKSGLTQVIIVTIDRGKLGSGSNSTTLHIASDNGSKQLTVYAGGTGLPVLTTNPITNLTNNTATFNGEITYDGTPKYTERGFVYSSTHPLPTTENTITKLTAATSSEAKFSTNVLTLSSNVTYHVRAYAINNLGTAYGNVISFNTGEVQTSISTSAATNIGVNFAKLNGTITNTGTPAYSQCGFCYSSTSTNPNINDTKAIVSVSGTGHYSADITNLAQETKYYFKAYAIQGANVIYGNTLNFTTSWTTTNVNTSAATSIGVNFATLNGAITNAGEPNYSQCGFCYSSTSTKPTINDTKIEISLSGTGNYSTTIKNLNQETKYYFNAYAIQGSNVIYGNTLNFTTAWSDAMVSTSNATNIDATSATLNATITDIGNPYYSERGFCYIDGNSTPTITNNKIEVPGLQSGNYFVDITNLKTKTTYNVRAYVIQGSKVIYGNVTTFSTVWIDAEVDTYGTSEIKLGSVKLNGDIIKLGVPIYNERGFCIIFKTYDEFLAGEDLTPTLETGKFIVTGSGLGRFSLTLSNIHEQMVYGVRAYALQGTEVVYGGIDYFIAPSVPDVSTEAVQNITPTSAALIGNIIFPGFPEYTERGFVVSITNSNPTLENSLKVPVPGHDSYGLYGINATGLTPNTTYFVRAFLKNEYKTVYGHVVFFKAE